MEQISYQFTKRVSAEGTIFLDNLPPDEEVSIRVVSKKAYRARLEKLRKEFQQNNPLAKMSEDELQAHLKQTREDTYDELYGNRPGYEHLA